MPQIVSKTYSSPPSYSLRFRFSVFVSLSDFDYNRVCLAGDRATLNRIDSRTGKALQLVGTFVLGVVCGGHRARPRTPALWRHSHATAGAVAEVNSDAGRRTEFHD